jgi:hypothetical protein
MKIKDILSLALQIFAWGGLLFLSLLFLLKYLGILHSPTTEEILIFVNEIIFSWLFWLTERISKIETNLMKEIYEIKLMMKKEKLRK